MDYKEQMKHSLKEITELSKMLPDDKRKKFLNMVKKTSEISELILNEKDTINVVHHVDADGLTSGAIMGNTLQRLDKDFEMFEWHLDPETLQEIPKDRLTIFVDSGTGQGEMIADAGFKRDRVIILDHHLKINNIPFPYEGNPTLFGIDGASEISGAGMTYLVARNFGFYDLSQFAVVGAVGDMMNSFGKFVGVMRVILQEAVQKGYIKIDILPQLFGRETRPLFVSLTYLNEPKLFKDQNESKAWLIKNNIISGADIEKRLNDLSEGEVKVLTRLLLKEFITRSPLILKPYAPIYLIGESYTLKNMPRREPIRDATEFSTLLNATNRQNKRDVGVSLMLDGGLKYLDEAKRILRRNRYQLRKTIVSILDEIDKRKRTYDFLVVLDETGTAPPHLSGTLLQLIIDRLTPLYDKPILGFTEIDEKTYKISMREPKVLYLKGINLALAVEKSAKLVGGYGGGHPPACGGAIPKTRIGEFVRILHRELTKQGLEKGFFILRN